VKFGNTASIMTDTDEFIKCIYNVVKIYSHFICYFDEQIHSIEFLKSLFVGIYNIVFLKIYNYHQDLNVWN